MKDFHDTHDNLSNWLSAKDKMMTVLGPISSDSRMVQSQVQQVQVFHYFRSHINKISFDIRHMAFVQVFNLLSFSTSSFYFLCLAIIIVQILLLHCSPQCLVYSYYLLLNFTFMTEVC